MPKRPTTTPVIPPEPRWELAADGSHSVATWPDPAVVLEVRAVRRDRYGDPRSDITARLDGEFIHQADMNPFDQRHRVDFHALASKRDGRIPWESYLARLLDGLRAALAQQATPETAGTTAPRKPLVVCMATVDPEAVTWLWEPYISRGKLTLLEGDPGVGKTWLALALAAAVTQGTRPFHEEATAPGTVLYMTAEDGLADTLRPRLDAAGADVSRVHVLVGWQEGDVNGTITLEDLPTIGSAMHQVTPALVVVDPLQGYLGAKVDMHRANETRPILAGLAALAEQYQCAVMCIRHLSKAAQDRAIYRGLGSIDFAAAARSILLVAQHPEQPAQRVMAQTKSSLAALGQSLAYELGQGVFRWVGVSEMTADQLLATQAPPDPPGALEEAQTFLEELLQGEPPPARKVFTEARKAHISEITLRRAKAMLGIESAKVLLAGKGTQKPRQAWVWQLPGQGAQRGDDVLNVPNDHLEHSPQSRARSGSTDIFQDDQDDHLKKSPQTRARPGSTGDAQDDHCGPLERIRADDHQPEEEVEL